MVKNVKRLYQEGSQLYAIIAVPEGKDWCKGCALNKRQDCGVSCKELGGKLRKISEGDFVECSDGHIYGIYYREGAANLLRWK